jgi:hypothetical protein
LVELKIIFNPMQELHGLMDLMLGEGEQERRPLTNLAQVRTQLAPET